MATVIPSGGWEFPMGSDPPKQMQKCSVLASHQARGRLTGHSQVSFWGPANARPMCLLLPLTSFVWPKNSALWNHCRTSLPARSSHPPAWSSHRPALWSLTGQSMMATTLQKMPSACPGGPVQMWQDSSLGGDLLAWEKHMEEGRAVARYRPSGSAALRAGLIFYHTNLRGDPRFC